MPVRVSETKTIHVEGQKETETYDDREIFVIGGHQTNLLAFVSPMCRSQEVQ
jgi:hypothetical protein